MFPFFYNLFVGIEEMHKMRTHVLQVHSVSWENAKCLCEILQVNSVLRKQTRFASNHNFSWDDVKIDDKFLNFSGSRVSQTNAQLLGEAQHFWANAYVSQVNAKIIGENYKRL